MHQLIWRLFPDRPHERRSFLFRQEYENEQLCGEDALDARKNAPLFYVVSQVQPVPADGFRVDIKEYHPQLTLGMRLHFTVRVNPVIARAQSEKRHSEKHDVLMDAKMKARQQGIHDPDEVRAAMNSAVIEWLAEKGRQHGFRLLERGTVEVSAYMQRVVKKRNITIQFSSVDLSGTFEVTDTEPFVDMLGNGIGHSRSFGCGLLMIRRA